jgi:hypothetical protein
MSAGKSKRQISKQKAKHHTILFIKADIYKRTGSLPELPDRVCYTKRLVLLYKVRNKTEDYTTSEGVVLTTGVALEEGAVLDGVATGKIRDTKLWEYFLASAKKPFIPTALPLSCWVSDELTFDQSTISPCDIAKVMVALAPLLVEDLFNKSIGSSGVLKASTSFLKFVAAHPSFWEEDPKETR